MIRERSLRARQKLVSKLPVTGELLRGSLLERTIRHSKDCPKCARGEGHLVFVLQHAQRRKAPQLVRANAGRRMRVDTTVVETDIHHPTGQYFTGGRVRVAGKPNEFGKMVKLQEAENQIITDYEVYARRPHDSDLLIAAIETHQALLGRTPRLVAADAAFYSAKNEAAARAKGVKRVCIPNRSTKSLERKREQRKRWFRNGQKWRTGSEGWISVVKRRHGLDRCRYRGYIGMNRWVGLGVIADNVLNIGRAIERRAAP